MHLFAKHCNIVIFTSIDWRLYFRPNYRIILKYLFKIKQRLDLHKNRPLIFVSATEDTETATEIRKKMNFMENGEQIYLVLRLKG